MDVSMSFGRWKVLVVSRHGNVQRTFHRLEESKKHNSKNMNKTFLTTLTISAVLLFCSLTTFASQGSNVITLENEVVKVQFDKETGTLVYLLYKKANWEIARRPELAQSFRMLVPAPDLDRRDNTIWGKGHKLKKYELSPNGTELTLYWEGLNSDAISNMAISFEGRVKLTNDGLIFDGKVNNQSGLVIDAVYWPYVGDFTTPDKTQESNWLHFEYGGGMQKWGITPNFGMNYFMFYSGVDNPTQFHRTQYANFGLYQAKDRGIYFLYDDTTVEHLCAFSFELKPGVETPSGMWGGSVPRGDSISGQPVHIEFSPVHFSFIHPGKEHQLKPIVMNPYMGDWHAGSDFYKEWRETWRKELPVPEWAANVHSWQQIHIFSAEDRAVFKFPELVEYCKECKEHSVEALQLTGWFRGGQDRDDPSHDIAHQLGAWQELYDAIKTCEEMGVRVILFTKFTWGDISSDWFREELINYATKDPYGDFHWYRGYPYNTATQLNNFNTRRFSPMCPYSKEWQAIVEAEYRKVLELGASGMLFDENQHHGDHFYCYDPTHGHEVPAYIPGGTKYLEKIFHDLAAEYNPDFLLVGESNRDIQFQDYHMSYFRINKDHVPMYRYVAPHELKMIAVVGYNDRLTINQALMFNYIISYEPRYFKGKLSEFPLTIEYGKKVDALRAKYQDYLWHGQFRDKLGASVLAGKKPHENYSVFLNKETRKRAVVISNFDNDNAITIRADLPGVKGQLVYVTPENPTETPYRRRVSVAPNSVVVLIEK
jgi:hypothetical protein